jgi:hypothetical protein
MSDAASPISLTLSPRLDASLAEGWEAWEAAARAAGPPAVAGWIAQRLGRPQLRADLQSDVESFLAATDGEERALAIADLAEIVEGHDDVLADTLWEALLALGFEQEDPDTITEAISRLAAIAEEHGDPLAAAEYHIDFLNWRRQDDHTSDPEAVADAFDEIIRLAGVDGDRQAVAMWEYRLASFIRLEESGDERAYAGDWEQSPIAYESWE